MNREILFDAQKCLTIKDGICERKIVNLVVLSENHNPDELIQILCDLYYEKHRFISRLLEQDENQPLATVLCSKSSFSSSIQSLINLIA